MAPTAQTAFGAVKCKTKDCEMFILRKRLGIYDPDRITIPECEEGTFKELCRSCHQEHSYIMEDAIVVVAYLPRAD